MIVITVQKYDDGINGVAFGNCITWGRIS